LVHLPDVVGLEDFSRPINLIFSIGAIYYVHIYNSAFASIVERFRSREDDPRVGASNGQEKGHNRNDGQPCLLPAPPGPDFETLARQVGAVRREPRKFDCRMLMESLVAVSQSLCPSLAAVAVDLSLRFRNTVSRQAVAERLTDGFVTLIEKVVALALAQTQRRMAGAAEGVFAAFGRVLVEDSTVIRLPPRLAGIYPGPRNQTGKPQAAMRLQTVLELKRDVVLEVRRSAYTHNDQAASPEILHLVQAGDLVLRDLGYFATGVFRRLADRKAYFLSRLHTAAAVLDPRTGAKIDLPTLLRRAGTVDIDVLLGCTERFPVRLVACRVPPDVAAERRRQARTNPDTRARTSTTKLALLDWELFVTNVPRDLWSTRVVAQVYGFRWRIEMLFKAWKSFLHLNDVPPRASQREVICFALARLMYAIDFQSNTWQVVRYTLLQRGRHASMLKTVSLFTGPSAALLRDVLRHDPGDLAEVLIRHCSYEKRRRVSYADAFAYYNGLSTPPPTLSAAEEHHARGQVLTP